MLERCFELGAQPIYGTLRDLNLIAVITATTWRNASLSTQRMLFGQHFIYAHDLAEDVARTSTTTRAGPDKNSTRPSYAVVVSRSTNETLL
ncbi:hypothetical protein Plhal703r1_c61g0165681 [Plasmopara halstedii]